MKRHLMLVVAFVGILLAGKISLTSASSTISPVLNTPATQNLAALVELSEAELERARQGLTISPVEINAGAGRTRLLIGLGSYLVNAAGACNDCHTNPSYAAGGDPFFGQPAKVNAANFLAGGVKFGPFTSRNLTPDPKRGNLPAGLRLEQFIQVIRTGQDRDLRHPQISPLLQVMPWPVYRHMSDRDLQAIYLYLSVIPHAEPAPE
ncbi:MAG: cytochrome C [Acidobacteriota bacterium]